MIARFAAERLKSHGSKKSIFNLGGEEQLTHLGKSLAEIERLDDDPRSDDEDDDETKRLDGENLQFHLFPLPFIKETKANNWLR